MKTFNYPYSFFLFYLFITLSIQKLICPPNEPFEAITNDSPWMTDYNNDEEKYFFFYFRTKNGKQFNDLWKGLPYQGLYSICHFGDKSLITPSNIDVTTLLNYNTSSTNNYHLYETICGNKITSSYVCVDFVFDKMDSPYYLIFDVVNNDNNEHRFQFLATQRFLGLTEFPLTNKIVIPGKSVIKVKIPLIVNNNYIDPITNNAFRIHYISVNGVQSTEPFWDETGSYNLLGCNLSVKFEHTGDVGIATYSLMHKIKPQQSTITGKMNCESRNSYCKENTFCKNSQCVQCDEPGCLQCDSNVCNKCPSTTTEWDNLNHSGKCIIDYLDLTKFSDQIFLKSSGLDNHQEPKPQVPPAIHWRVTMEYWTYINYPKLMEEAKLNLIYKDFLSITMTKDMDDNVNIFCTPIEWLYPVTDVDPNMTIQDYLNNELGAFYMQDKMESVSSKWFYTRCAFNLDTNKAYLNDQVEYNLKIPQLFTDFNNIPFQMKKFYKPDQFTDFIFQGFSGVKTYIYLRNINLYREYIPQNIITKYFNVHKITKPSDFPQLLYSIPFDEVISKGNGEYTFTTYNFYKREINGAFNIYDEIIIEKENVLTLQTKDLMPPRNFYRLNLLPFNKQYPTCEYYQNPIDIDCEKNTSLHMNKCFEDQKPYVCEEADPPYYLDVNNLKCNTECPKGFYHPPHDTTYQKRNYCSAECDESTQICPWSKEHYTNIQYFTCPSGFFDLYYKCYRNDELLVDSNALFFSSTLNSHSIFIPLDHQYSSYVIEVWFYFDQRFPIDEKNDPILQNRVILMTNSFKVIYGVQKTEPPYNNVVTNAGIQTTSDFHNKYGWNHFILSYDKHVGGNHEYWASFLNDLYLWRMKELPCHINPADLTLKYIVFCNDDYQISSVGDKCQNTFWVNAYYRNLRIWDLKYTTRYAVFYGFQFEDVFNIMEKHHYTMKLNNINKNIIVDSIEGKNGILPILTGNANENPDNESFINYESNFSYEEVKGGGIYIIKNPLVKKLVDISYEDCDSHCSICSGPNNNQCLMCNEGYALFNYHCFFDPKDQKTENFYTYRNPSINMPEKLSLNIHRDVIDKWEFLTLFFFIKIYGFSKEVKEREVQKLIIFNDNENFYLAYDPDDQHESLCIYHQGVKIYEYSPFREVHFGHWVPVSIAIFRESIRTFRINMIQAAIYYENLEYLDTRPHYLYLSLNEFSITNRWIGLLADVKIFNHFIMNAWGLVKQNNEPKIAFTEYGKYVVYEIDMKTKTSSKNCLLKSDILTTTDSGFELVCVNDYNPHWYQCGSTNNKNYIGWHQGESSEGKCNGYCGTVNLSKKRCLGNWDNPWTDSDAKQHLVINNSCENSDLDWFEWVIIQDHSVNKLKCIHLYYLDYARFKKAEAINGVKSPPVVFSIDFWFYTQSVYNYNVNDLQMNNFVSFEIEWDYHIRIKIESIKDDPTNVLDNQYTYYARCTPQIISGQSDKDPITNSIALGNRHKAWTYIACGVNVSTKKTYLTNKNKLDNEISYESTNTIPLNKVQFTLKENSPNGYGITFIHELRLWQCYSCTPSFRNFDYKKNNFNFNDVLHVFRGSNKYTDVTDICNGVQFKLEEVEDFKGYTVLDDWYDYLTCDESQYEYYNEDETGKGWCFTHYNIARFNDFQFTIPSSRTGRYTIEFWFFVEEALQMGQGINIIWERHMSISLVRDSSITTTINAICFPQAYRDKVDGLRGLEIYDLYDQALNKEKEAYHAGSNKWQFVRCALDHSRKLYYMDKTNEKYLEPETIYGNTQNYRAFRYFELNPTSILLFEHANEINTRIFLRSFRAYREYIDPRIDDIKYYDFRNYVNEDFWPLLLYIDFKDYSYDANNPGLIYKIYDESNHMDSKEYHLGSFRTNDTDPYYPTYPELIELTLCLDGARNGVNGDCRDQTCLFCYSKENQLFWPRKHNSYLDMTTLTENPDCKGYTRLPDSSNDRAYCLLDCSDNNIDTCAEKNNVINDYNTYSESFTCKDGYTRVYYECIDNSLIQNSAMYFSNWFSFSDIVYTADINIQSYYVEIWFKFDIINYNKEITQQETYLLAPPHLIIQDEKDQLYKYANTQISSGTYFYTLMSINMYEWNRIIIENHFDAKTNMYSIRVFVNYDFDNPDVTITQLNANTYDMTLKGLGFCNQPLTDCTIKNVLYMKRWGVAWYRNLRIWNEQISSLELIQACEIGYTQLLQSQYYYFQLTIDYIKGNTLLDRTDLTNPNKVLSNKWWYDKPTRKNYDNEMRENYSVNTFDYSFLNPGNFITGLNDLGTEYQLGACSNSCKRCYSSASNNCYECQNGYALYGKTCKTVTGYYFKTPTDNPTIKSVSLLTDIVSLPFDIKTQSPLTITIWMKYFGINLDAAPKTQYPIIYFYQIESFFGYDKNSESFILQLKDVENGTGEKIAFKVKIKEYVGQWIHLGFSLHRSSVNDYTVFPHMFNFMINQEVLVPNTDFNPKTFPVYFDQVTFNMEPIAFFSDIKFYSTFWFGTYGHVNALSSTRNKDLIFEVLLYGSANDNCISDAELDGTTVSTIRPVCVADYLPYDDLLNQCTSDYSYINLDLPTTPPCESCTSNCITQCFNSNEQSCSSNYYEGLYWIATQEPIVSYYSQRVDSINFAFYEPIVVNGINMVQNDEASLEFWVNIYQYKDDGFDSIDIIWDKHVRVKIEAIKGTQGQANIICYPYTDINDLAIEENVNDKELYTLGQWSYVRCMIDRYHKHYRLNNHIQIYYSFPIIINQIESSLKIIDNTQMFNYGFSFIRELKLFSSYNYGFINNEFWDDSQHNLTPEKYKYLLHYFKNFFTSDTIRSATLYDEVTQYTNPLTLKQGRIGYNYVIDFEYLNLCNEGYCFSQATQKCEIYNTVDCNIARDDTGKCLLCASSKPYLKEDDQCYSQCEPNYYNDDYLMQCRSCDVTCLTCFGKKENNCLSCPANPSLYLVEDLHICVPNCEQYDLTNDLFTQVCVPFNAIGNIIYPNISQPIDLNGFNELRAEVLATAEKYDLQWKFNLIESINLNVGYRNFSIGDIPDNISPFVGITSQENVTLNPNFTFKNGLKYVFELDVIKSNGVFNTTITLQFIITINDKPIAGNLNTLPSSGYISTNYLFTCNECTDDNSEKNELTYKFVYCPDPNDLNNEVLLQDFSEHSETLKTFGSLPTVNDEYIIKCYCKDKMGEVGESTATIKCYAPPNESGVNVPIIDSIQGIDVDKTLTSEQLSNRAEFLSTITVDYPKEPILNRTNVTTDDKLLVLHDPVNTFRDEYCNKRGESYTIDRYLTCDCSNYYGEVCQIDGNSYNEVISLYKKIYKKISEAQTSVFDWYLLNGIQKLIRSGSMFMPIEQMDFMVQSIEYTTLNMQNFASDIMNNKNYEKLFDIYNSLLEYGMFMVNRLKMKNFIEINSKLPNGTYDGDLIRNATLTKEQMLVMEDYFGRVREGLDAIMKFFADKKFEITFVNKNLNVYIALLNENFSFKTFFSLEQQLYESYFDVSNCLSNVMKSTTSTSSYKIFMTAIVWKVSPFMYQELLYNNNTSPVVSIEFIDYKTLKRVYLTDCGLGNEIEIYFPVVSYLMTPRINDKRDYVSPENQFESTSDIFNDPVYIDSKGQVFNSTPQERIDQYFVPFNLSCKYYDSSLNQFQTDGVDYSLFTDDNYIQCKSLHLTDFVIEHYDIHGEFHINSRFFYLKHYMLFAFGDNYDYNPAFLFAIVFIVLYFVLIIIYTMIEKCVNQKEQLLNYLKQSIIRINLPYRDSYEFEDNLQLSPEIRQRLQSNKKRNPDLFENNIDINNVDVMIMADKLTKYGKTYQENQNSIGNQNDFFNKMTEKGTESNTQANFFRANTDGADYEDDTKSGDVLQLDREDPKKKNKRLNKFFQVGFTGVDRIEKFKKEIKVNEDNEFIVEDVKEENNTPFPNPPKKMKKAKMDNLIDGKKIANRDMKFFEVEGQKHKRKVNPFQEEFDHYIPRFEKPKVVSNTLDFYDKEKEKEDKRNYLDEYNQKTNRNGIEGLDNQEADVRIIQTQNKTEIDFQAENIKEELPRLEINLTIEKKLLELSRLSLDCFHFFSKNLYNRHIILTTFARFNLCYARYKRVGNFIGQLFLYLFFLSIFFTADEKMEIMNKKNSAEILLFIVYCISSVIGSNLLIHLPSFMFYIDVKEFRLIYDTIREDRGLEIFKEYDKLVKHRFWWNFLGVFIQWIYYFVSIYFSFGFCATYYYQRTTFFWAFIISFCLDILLFEFIWELIISLLYAIRNKGRCVIRLCEFLNRMRNMRTLT